jgi:hypothetical protein
MNVSRRKIAGAIAGLTVFGAVFASAASLGGITSGQVGADDAAVTSCDTDGVTTAYTTSWDATDDRYEVTTVTVSGIAVACATKTLSVSLTDGTNQIGSGTGTVVGTSLAVTMSPSASAEATTGVHVAIA